MMMHLTRRVSRIFNPEILRKRATAELNFQKKIFGQLAPKFSFFVTRTSILVAKNYIQELMDLVL